ncbi:MAG: TonB-dependent receptor [Pseudomonadota bacterium]
MKPITITGERVERTVFETPSSVVAIPGEDLDETPAIQNVEDVLEDIPNVTVFGASNEGPVIRGLQTGGPLSGAPSFLAGTLPRAVLTIDGRILSFSEFIFGTSSVYDLERIEVFRGPQTTSQGTNAIAGAFYITTKDPTYDLEFSSRARASNFDGFQGSAHVNVPLVQNELAFRAAFDYRQRDTFIELDTPGQLLIDEVFRFEQLTGRAKLLWEPVAIPDLQAKLTYSHTETSSPQTELVDEPFEELTRTTNPDPSAFTTEADTIIADVTYDFSDNVSLTSKFYWSQFDSARLVADPNTGAAEIAGNDFTNDTRLNFSLLDGRLTGVSGLYLRLVEQDELFVFTQTLTDIEDLRTALGIYFESTYQFTDRFDATAGVRYQLDRQEREGVAFGGAPFAVDLDFDEQFDALLPKFAVGYNVNDDLRIGGIVSRGFNPGGVNISLNTLFFGQPNPFFEFDEETLWNFELFARARLFDNRLALDTNVFFTDFDDTQRASTTILPTGIPDTIVLNAEDARSFGLETAAKFQATDRLKLSGSLGLISTEFQEFSESTAGIVGNEFRGAPTVTGAFGFDFELIDDFFIGSNVRFTSSYFSDDENDPDEEIEAFAIVDVRMQYEPHDNFRVFGFVNNVFNEITPVNANRFGAGLVLSTTVPREFGGGVSIKF